MSKMPDDLLAMFRARVESLRLRHLILAIVGFVCAAGTWALPQKEAPFGAKVFISLACVGFALWQGSLRIQIARGIRRVEAGSPKVVWLYLQKVSFNGSAVMGVMVGFEDGTRAELPLQSPTTAPQILERLKLAFPFVTVGFTEELETAFRADPQRLLGEGESHRQIK